MYKLYIWTSAHAMRKDGAYGLINKTPLLEVLYRYRGDERSVLAKLEWYNPTGSIKDRIAYHIITKSRNNGTLKPGMPIIEATSGNTGIAFAALGKAFGHPVDIFMPDWMSQERIALMKSYGATVHLVSHEEGGFKGSVEQADELARKVGGFRPNQFSNEDNSEAHYLTTGPELWDQAGSLGKRVEAFVAGVGTGGTVMGTGKYLRERSASAKVHPLEPSNSPTLSTGYKVGKHRIQGISDEFIPPILRLDELDEVIQVDDGDAILAAQKFASVLGIGVGISSGANFLGAVQLQDKYGPNTVVATVFADCNKKYLTTDYVRQETIKDDAISRQLELIGCVMHF